MYEQNDGSPIGAMMLLVIAAIYFYFAYAQYRIAQKTNHKNPWMAWIPIANTFQLVEMAAKPIWWFLLLLVPVVNLFCFGILWAEVAKRVNCASVWGWMILFPIINFVAIGLMAFGSGGSGGSSSGYQPPVPPKPEEHKEPQQIG